MDPAASQAPTSFSRAMLSRTDSAQAARKTNASTGMLHKGRKIGSIQKKSSRNIGKDRNSTNTKKPKPHHHMDPGRVNQSINSGSQRKSGGISGSQCHLSAPSVGGNHQSHNSFLFQVPASRPWKVLEVPSGHIIFKCY